MILTRRNAQLVYNRNDTNNNDGIHTNDKDKKNNDINSPAVLDRLIRLRKLMITRVFSRNFLLRLLLFLYFY